MKTIGLIGGMSWESTVEYYRIINQEVGRRLGGLHSAKLLMYSVDFGELEPIMREGNWEEIGGHVAGIAKILQNAGAYVILLCTNTVHKVASWIESAIAIPFIHIADATGEEVSRKGMNKVGLLGTRYTMEEDFYRNRLTDTKLHSSRNCTPTGFSRLLGMLTQRVGAILGATWYEKFGLPVLIPPDEERSLVNDVTFNELCHGVINQSSKHRFKNVIDELAGRGAEGIILGNTEIPMLIKESDSPVPLFDTTSIHALKAVDFALG